MSNQESHARGRLSFIEQEHPPAPRMLLLLIAAIMLFIGVVSLSAGTALTFAAGSETVDQYGIYMPIIASKHPGGIVGTVTFKNNPASGVKVELYLFDQEKWSPVSSAVTNNRGLYQFKDSAGLENGQKYYVRFGPNESDPRYVYSWYGPILESYRPGDAALGGDFDITDVPLKSPASGAKAPLPVTFEWDKRDFAVEDYRVVMLDPISAASWDTRFIRDEESITITTLASDIEFNKNYEWYVEVFSQVDSFGESFMLNKIEFMENSGLSRSRRSEAFTAVDDWQQGSRSGR